MNITKKIFFLSLLTFFVLQGSPVFAKKTINDATAFLKETAVPTGITTENVETRIGNIVKSALTLVGLVFLLLMIYGGMKWMTARGNDAEIEQAKETIIAATIGIVIIIGAYALTNFLTSRVLQGTTGGGPAGGSPDADPTGIQGCCEYQVNPFTWTAFTMTENQCVQTCKSSLGENNCASGTNYIFTPGEGIAECEVKRANSLR